MNLSAHAVLYPYYASRQSSSRWALFLAGLPHLCMGALISLDLFRRSLSSNPANSLLEHSNEILLVPFLAASLVIVLYARRRDHPLWTASWDGYAILLSILAVGILLASLLGGGWEYQGVYMVLGLLVFLVGYYLRFRDARKHALLIGLVLLPFVALSSLDTVPLFTQAIFVLALYLLYSFLASWVVIAPRWSSAVSVALAASLLAGAVQGLVFVTFSVAPGELYDLQAEATRGFLIHVLFTTTYYLSPWLLWTIRDLFSREVP